MAPSATLKRKQTSGSRDPLQNSHRSSKRVKISHARTILAQTSDKALNSHGDLDISAFVKAREFEIKAMGASMGASKKSLSKRAFQQVPKDLRRRTASHNVKKMPKRLRARAAKEMREDNTPTVTSRRRKPTPHQRLRLQKAKELKKLGVLKKKEKRDESMKQNPGETDPEKMVLTTPPISKLKRNILSKPGKPPAKFRKRQIHKQWLPTHLYHTKRAFMPPPKEPLWRFAIPLTPTDKCYRPTHRAISYRGCIAWDTSYMGIIGVEGVESSLIGLLRNIGVHEQALVGKREAKWRNGTRAWDGWIREREGEKRWISKVEIIWCPESSNEEPREYVPFETPVDHEKQAVRDKTDDGTDVTQVNARPAAASKGTARKSLKRVKRRLFIRVHPSAFLQTWDEVLKAAKRQGPPAMVEDLRFEIGSIEIAGPGSTEALVGALHPVKAPEAFVKDAAEDEWEDIDTMEAIWSQLAGVSNPSLLPPKAILSFNISDPRLHYPPRTAQPPKSEHAGHDLLETLSSWPLDQKQIPPDIFDRTKRLTACRKLSSQKAVNRRKGKSLPGAYPDPLPEDPKIPTLLTVSRSALPARQGSWTLLVPWDCVLPIWYYLMHYPLATGGNPRFGGLQEQQQVAFEQSMPWFPQDCPGTHAGYAWELTERDKKKLEWARRPKGKRTEWDSIDLGNGKKGEIGIGWACDWERLFQGLPSASTDNAEKSKVAQVAEDIGETKSADNTQKNAQEERVPTKPSSPPLSIHHLPSPSSITTAIPATALTPIHLTLITTGHPNRNARIYRLPTTNDPLRAKWLAFTQIGKHVKDRRRSQPKSKSKDQPSHVRSQQLAASLLAPSSSTILADTQVPKAGDPSYPCVPDETDLIGFVTTANYHLGQGRCEAIGNVAVARVLGEESKRWKAVERNLCIVRDSGQILGRLARWRFCEDT